MSADIGFCGSAMSCVFLSRLRQEHLRRAPGSGLAATPAHDDTQYRVDERILVQAEDVELLAAVGLELAQRGALDGEHAEDDGRPRRAYSAAAEYTGGTSPSGNSHVHAPSRPGTSLVRSRGLAKPPRRKSRNNRSVGVISSHYLNARHDHSVLDPRADDAVPSGKAGCLGHHP